jgi:hypothetical protein
MAQFQINDTMSDASVVVDLDFNINPVGDNSWSTSSGDENVLGVDHGTWSSEGIANRLLINNASGIQIAVLNIDMAVNPIDPFKNLSVGDTGEGLLSKENGLISWALVAK